MTIKRLVLGVLTLVVLFLVSFSLIASWQQPQIQSRLELYETNLQLHFSEWQPDRGKDAILTFSAGDPIKTALKQYRAVRESAQSNLEKAREQLKQLQFEATPLPAPEVPLKVTPAVETSAAPKQQPLLSSIAQLETLVNELDLRSGLLQAKQGEIDRAIETWTQLSDRARSHLSENATAKTAAVLIGLWSDPPRILPDAQQSIQRQLDGWFRYQGLSRLYDLQQRQDDLVKLQAKEQEIAQQAVVKLAIVSILPILLFLIGVVVLIFLVGQRLIKGRDSLLAQNTLSWSTPWDAEIVWQVFVLGFFIMGQILVPLALYLLQIKPSASDIRSEAFYVLASYLILALGGVFVLYFSIKPFFPLPEKEELFRLDLGGNWFWWGLGGYFAALPLVLVVSLINRSIWQGQGGSNPLLSLALESQDRVALLIFFSTAAIAAPLFEEFLFRGFLLPSLTRYMPVWGAIAASSFIFALAHLSLSEVLPLATLGMVLGVVYARSRNLLAPMLLHSLWNGGTLLSLFILGSGST